MNDARFVKQPSEVFDVSVDFSLNLATDEIITGKAAAAYEGETVVTDDVIESSEIVGTDQISVKVKAGTDGSVYRLVISATTSEDNTWTQDIDMEVRD